jgi:DNA-directed RNA polymerase specialized sigma24 family protein
MTRSIQLLCQYHQSRDEAAFAELVRQELDLVYSTALRNLGDPELARDASQIVFADVAKKAEFLSRSSSLSGWLYRHTGFVASKLRRQEIRRRQREAKAMESQEQEPPMIPTATTEEIRPLLDWAMGRLKVA